MKAVATTRYAALLRAINVGGHIVKMDALRKSFATMGFGYDETFIASGNVLFDAPTGGARRLEEQIAMELERLLGYPVATMVRTGSQLASVVEHEPFPRTLIDPEKHRLYIGFIGGKPNADVAKRVAGMRTSVDELVIRGQELYWGCRTSFSNSEITGAQLEKALALPMTFRSITTVRKLAAKLSS
jgi:uncharacterized protein (DUF1697 family)